MNTLKKTKEILNKYNITAKKAFGQNFLIDDDILKNISDIADMKENELIVEIGPGLGNLTEYLCSNKMLLVEIDDRMLEILGDRFKNNNNITIINEDILNVDIDNEILKIENLENVKFTNVKVVANLPYYITSPIIFKLLEDSKRINEIVVMVQEEVADRMVAKTNSKDYGILTVMINYFASASKEIKVPQTAFLPAPNVTSAVVKIVKESNKYSTDYVQFKELVHKAFANRRKKMINSLSINKYNNLEKNDIISILNKCGISENTRAEQLSIEKYIEICKMSK